MTPAARAFGHPLWGSPMSTRLTPTPPPGGRGYRKAVGEVESCGIRVQPASPTAEH